MSNSNQLCNRNVSLFSQLISFKKQFLIDQNLSYTHKGMCELLKNNIKEHSYTKMIIESYDTLSKSQAIQFLQRASTTESKLSLLDAMKDKVTLSTKEIDELLSTTNSSSFDITDASSFDNLSYLSLCIPQQQSPHIFTSSNNAVQSARTSSNANKRSSLLRGLFGRYSSKKRAIVVKQPLKPSQQANKKRIISGGDQVKLSSTRVSHVERPYQLKHPYDINIQGDTVDNQKQTTNNNEVQLLCQGLRYDFKQIKGTSAINASENKQSFKDNSIPIPFVSHSSLIQDKSLSSLSDPISTRRHNNEQKQHIQSAHCVGGIPRMKITNTTLEKIFFNADQHKYHVQTPNYHYPKRLSAIEILANQHLPIVTPHNSTGLCWYSANQRPMNRTISFSKRVNSYKENTRFGSSSDSRDTSSSSNSSSTSHSTKANKTSSSSSTTSTSRKTSKSSSSGTASSSQPGQQTIKTNGQYNRNQNDKDDVIRIDLNSITSQTSTSTSSTSIQPCHQRSISRKQWSTVSSTTTTNDNDSSSSVSSPSSLTVAINNNNNLINSVNKFTNKVTSSNQLLSDLFSPVNHWSLGKFIVKRQRIEPNMIT